MPMPPMGEEPPMAPEMGPEPPMGDEPSMDGPDAGGEGDDDELMNIINGLSVEDKAAVKKYAESMADNNGGGDDEPPMSEEPPMPMESKQKIDSMVNEISDELMNGKRKRFEKHITNNKVSKNNPFVSNR